MTNEEVGMYIRMLCILHQSGGEIDKVSFYAFIGDHDSVRAKFEIEGNMVYNKRLVDEMAKRAKKSSSLSDNAKKRWEKQCKSNAIASNLHMPIEDVNEDVIKTKRTTIPTLEEVKAYFKEKNTKIDPDTFWNWYEARGWNGIKKWKSCLVTWEKRNVGFTAFAVTIPKPPVVNETLEMMKEWEKEKK